MDNYSLIMITTFELAEAIGEILQKKYKPHIWLEISQVEFGGPHSVTNGGVCIKFYPNNSPGGIRFMFLKNGMWYHTVCFTDDNEDYYRSVIPDKNNFYNISSPDMLEKIFDICDGIIKWPNILVPTND